jgi:hypothetical protein
VSIDGRDDRLPVRPGRTHGERVAAPHPQDVTQVVGIGAGEGNDGAGAQGPFEVKGGHDGQ